MAQRAALPSQNQMLDAALEHMAKGGLESVTPRVLATHLYADPDAVARLFPERHDLHEAMARRLLDQFRPAVAPGQTWQDWLRMRARGMRQLLLGRRDAPRLAAGAERLHTGIAQEMLGPLMRDGFPPDRARSTLLTLDRFTIGWCLDEAGAIGRGTAEPRSLRDGQFEFALDALVAGLAATREQAPQNNLRARRRMMTMGVWAFLRHVRQSADLAYRVKDLTELDRRLLMDIQAGRVKRSADFIVVSGLDKAQVSRAVRRLVESGLLDRDGARGPFSITESGERLAEELTAIARRRNAEIIAGIEQADLDGFLALTAQITARAALLLEQEQSFEVEEELVSAPGSGEAETGPTRDRSTLVTSQLSTLFSYLQRSGALMIRRLADMSNFEWLVLSTIGELGPLTPVRLIELVERDHSQTRRTLRLLIQQGLVEQFAAPGQRGRVLQLSEQGKAVVLKLEDEGWRRDNLLYGEIQPERLESFIAVLESLTRNALTQLEPVADR